MSGFIDLFGWPEQLSPAAAERLALAQQQRPSWTSQAASKPPLPELEGEQIEALAACNAFLAANAPQCFTLHGLAGTGKTTVLASLARTFPYCFLAAYTGKAASVLARKTGADASTLHSLLYTPESDEKGKPIWVPKWPDGALQSSVVLIDEASMVSTVIAADLLETGAKVIAFGDPGQLPPIEDKPYFSLPDFSLHQILRQAAGSPIIRQAHAVRCGKSYTNDGEAFRVIDRTEAAARINWADVVLCWRNETRHRINEFVRRRRGITLNAPPQPGEPLMCLRNQGRFLNGEIFTVSDCIGSGLQLDGVQGRIGEPWFEWLEDPEREAPRRSVPFALAYCITAHKSQGSEWPRVLILDEIAGTERARWLYTANRVSPSLQLAWVVALGNVRRSCSWG